MPRMGGVDKLVAPRVGSTQIERSKMSALPDSLRLTTYTERNGGNMTGRVAYDIDAAAQATSAKPQTVTLAIRDRQLPAYRIDGQAVILHEDLTDWVKSHPRF